MAEVILPISLVYSNSSMGKLTHSHMIHQWFHFLVGRCQGLQLRHLGRLGPWTVRTSRSTLRRHVVFQGASDRDAAKGRKQSRWGWWINDWSWMAECKSKGPFRKTAGSKISPECKALFHDLTWIAPAKQESLGMILLNRCRPAFTALQAPLSRWWQTCTTPCQCHTCHPNAIHTSIERQSASKCQP